MFIRQDKASQVTSSFTGDGAMVSSHQYSNLQVEHAWLTNVQTSLLSDAEAGYAAAMVEYANALLNRNEGVVDIADTPQPVLQLQVGSCIDRGLKRKCRPNEDSLFITQGVLHSTSTSPQPFALFIVADGMGGHAYGQEASQLAIWSLVEYVCTALFLKQRMPDAFLPVLVEGVQYANQMVYQHNQELRTNMGATMTVALVSDTTAYLAHVGDSRLYLYHDPTGLSQITHDHSVVAALVAEGRIQPDDIYTHPMRNQIYRCLGGESTVEVDSAVVPLAAGDALLLCSDGLWEMVRDPQIADVLTTLRVDSSQTASALVQAALAGGGEDNVSVIVVRVSH